MKTNKSYLTRTAVAAFSLICLATSAFAGPAPMFMMMHGQMMMVTPMTKDMKLKNGCKVCMDGTVMSAKGEKMSLKDHDMLSAEGTMIMPSRHAHGG